MSTFNYAAILLTAQRLTSKFGYDVTLTKLDRGTDDPQKPWRGKADPRATPAAQVTVKGVMVPPSSAVELGLSTETEQLMKSSQGIYIVASSSDFTAYDEIVDGSARWRIDVRERLVPGATTVLWFFGVSK